MTTTPPTRTPSIPTVYGYPRQGPDRELKRALERYWRGDVDVTSLLDAVGQVRSVRLHTLHAAGLDELPVGDFSLYDHMLDTASLVGAVPDRYVHAFPDTSTDQGRLDRYFAMARGTDQLAPLEMTKWFDTNYHYLVPELTAGTTFSLDAEPLLAQISEAQQWGLPVRPVVVGPVTFLKLAKAADLAAEDFEPLSLISRLVPVYVELLARLADAGVGWVQLDEPAVVTDLSVAELDVLDQSYRQLTAATVGQGRPKILVASYFGQLGDAAAVLAGSGIEGLGVDLSSRGAGNLDPLTALPQLDRLRIIAGVVDGRNVWRTDWQQALDTLRTLSSTAGHLDVAASCSLLHVPHDVAREAGIDPDVAGWLAFADQKLEEITTLARGLSDGPETIAVELAANTDQLHARRTSTLVHNPVVRVRFPRFCGGISYKE